MDPIVLAGLRHRLRRPGDALAHVSIGTVPILWNNVDVDDLRHGTTAEEILDEIARTGYEGTQLGIGFPTGRELRRALADRDLRLAEVYYSIPPTQDGPATNADAIARERLRLLHDSGGDVLCVAFDVASPRMEWAGRADDPATPRLDDAGWQRLADHLHVIAREAAALGHRVAFHPHAGTYVETPDEVDRLVRGTIPELIGICLDVGHYLVGGGDPARALRELGSRVTHVHLKDVDPDVLARLRSGQAGGINGAIRARLFTELGSGALDLDDVLDALTARAYDGWLMVEQDSAWGPPSESAAIGRRVLAAALRRLAPARAA
ncbi:MAG: sugar phosphate isomerase/epimerase [Candidatus Limnocylindrales bacterium]